LSVFALRDAALVSKNAANTRVIDHTRTYYDGDAFTGLPLGQLGEYGLAVRAETLAFTDAFLDTTIGLRPVYLTAGPVAWTDEYPAEFQTLLPGLAGYQ